MKLTANTTPTSLGDLILAQYDSAVLSAIDAALSMSVNKYLTISPEDDLIIEQFAGYIDSDDVEDAAETITGGDQLTVRLFNLSKFLVYTASGESDFDILQSLT